MRRGLSYLFLILFGIGLAFATTELSLRLLGFPSRMLEFEPLDDSGFHFMKPNQHFVERWYDRQGAYRVSINSAGFRDNELQYPDGFKIFVLGDSMTFGSGVEFEHTFVDRLEKKLRFAFPGLGIEVINGGAAGATIDSETAVFMHKGLLLRPRVAILAFFANDVADLRRRQLDNQVYKPISFPLKRYVRQTALYIQLYKFKVYWLRQLYWGKANLPPVVMATEADFYASELSSFWKESWKNYEMRMGNFFTLSRRYGVQPILLIIPELYQVENVRLAPQPQLILTRMAQSYGVPVVNPLDSFRAYFERGGRLYIPNDGHLTRDGHEIVAEALFRELYDLLAQRTD